MFRDRIGATYAPLGRQLSKERPRSWAYPDRPPNPHRHRVAHRHRQQSDDGQVMFQKWRNKEENWTKYRKDRQSRFARRTLLQSLCDEEFNKPHVKAVGHASHESGDLGLLSDNSGWAEEPVSSRHAPSDPGIQPDALPDCLPERYTTITDAKDVAQFVAAASYMVSLGGKPAPDLRYGVLFIPCGEEHMFLAQKDYSLSLEQRKGISAAKKEANLDPANNMLVAKSDMTNSMDSEVFEMYDKKLMKRRWHREKEEQSAKAKGLVKNAEGQWVTKKEAMTCCDHLEEEWMETNRRLHVFYQKELQRLADELAGKAEPKSDEESQGTAEEAGESGSPVPPETPTPPEPKISMHSASAMDESGAQHEGSTEQRDAPWPDEPAIHEQELLPVQPLSPDARLALESMLGAASVPKVAQSHRKPFIRRLLRRPSARPREASTPTVATPTRTISQMALRQVSAVAKKLADGSLSENPGIDEGLWSNLQAGLSRAPTP